MTILFGILTLLFSLLYLRERAGNRSLNREILYIRERVHRLAQASTEESGYVLIPSENAEIRGLAAELNRLLETFQLQKADFGRSRRAMGQMLTNISHDLRTPLTVLRGYSELLRREAKSGVMYSDIRDMVSKIDSKTAELVDTINGYFTMSKIESGDMSLDLQKIDLTELCHEVILDYYDVLEKADCEVDIQIGPSPVSAYADGDALKRILKNLIDNALRHGGAGRYLGFRLRETADGAVIEIEDHGRGIPAEDQDAIFSRNYTTDRGHAGSGLGLAIAKNLALQMEADIRVSSEPDKRTVFTLSLKS